jgi:hypothetical protein
VIFVLGHVALAFKGGFRARMRAMIFGREAETS